VKWKRNETNSRETNGQFLKKKKKNGAQLINLDQYIWQKRRVRKAVLMTAFKGTC